MKILSNQKGLISKVKKAVSKSGFKPLLSKKINILSVSEKESQRFNRLYRKRNRPTNVLSFRYGQEYGEILLCPALIRKEAKEQKNSYSFQTKWMIIHGLLHLAGLDHEKAGKEGIGFVRIENKLLKL